MYVLFVNEIEQAKTFKIGVFLSLFPVRNGVIESTSKMHKLVI